MICVKLLIVKKIFLNVDNKRFDDVILKVVVRGGGWGCGGH